MRSSIMSRSVVALATVAIASAALAATPANAAPAGVTRDQVLTAINGLRTAEANDTTAVSPATARALEAIIVAGCDVSFANRDKIQFSVFDTQVTAVGDDAQGILLHAIIEREFNAGSDCLISAFAATNASYQLSGTASFVGQKSSEGSEGTTTVKVQSAPLTGDVFVSAPRNASDPALTGVDGPLSATAAGNATKTTKVTTSTKVTDKKSKAEKKAAKTKYSKRLAQAKKNYAKAVDKAGSSKSKKAAAKRVYAKARALAKAKFKYSIAGYKIVKKTTTVNDVQPFSVTTTRLFNLG